MKISLTVYVLVLAVVALATLVSLVKAGFILAQFALFAGVTLAVFSVIVWYWTAKRKGPADRNTRR